MKSSENDEMLPSPSAGSPFSSATATELQALDVSSYVSSPAEWIFLRIYANIQNAVEAYQLSGLPIPLGIPIEETVRSFTSLPRIHIAMGIMERRTRYIERVIDKAWCVEKLIGTMAQAEALGEVTPQISAISKIADIKGLNAPVKIEDDDAARREKQALERATREVEAIMGKERAQTPQEIVATIAEVIE